MGGHRGAPRGVSREPKDPRREGGRGGCQGGEAQRDEGRGALSAPEERLRQPQGSCQEDRPPLQVLLPPRRVRAPYSWRRRLGGGMLCSPQGAVPCPAPRRAGMGDGGGEGQGVQGADVGRRGKVGQGKLAQVKEIGIGKTAAYGLEPRYGGV